jgi:hypothetical protein
MGQIFASNWCLSHQQQERKQEQIVKEVIVRVDERNSPVRQPDSQCCYCYIFAQQNKTLVATQETLTHAYWRALKAPTPDCSGCAKGHPHVNHLRNVESSGCCFCFLTANSQRCIIPWQVINDACEKRTLASSPNCLSCLRYIRGCIYCGIPLTLQNHCTGFENVQYTAEWEDDYTLNWRADGCRHGHPDWYPSNLKFPLQACREHCGG